LQTSDPAIRSILTSMTSYIWSLSTSTELPHFVLISFVQIKIICIALRIYYYNNITYILKAHKKYFLFLIILRSLWSKFTHKSIKYFLSITNKMQLYTIFFITVNALHVSGGFSVHHQELKNCIHSIGYMSSLLAATASGSSKQVRHIIKEIIKEMPGSVPSGTPYIIHWQASIQLRHTKF
jgi:hypothetical protein